MLKKTLTILAGSIVCIYALFLLLPLVLSPVLNSFVSDIVQTVEKQTGFKVQLNKPALMTSFKLEIMAKANKLEIYQPDGQLFSKVENGLIKMPLLPLLARKIRLSLIKADDLTINMYIKKNGGFLIEDFFKAENSPSDETSSAIEQNSQALPFGFKLSNKLPDVKIKKHTVNFIQDGKNNSLYGQNTIVSDFILNKKIKIQSVGGLNVNQNDVFTYDIKVFNKIMPELNLNELIFTQNNSTGKKNVQTAKKFDAAAFFKLLSQNPFEADLSMDIKTGGTMDKPQIYGSLNINKITLSSTGRRILDGYADFIFNKFKVNINSKFNTANSENTDISGDIKYDSSPNIDILFKSNATLKSIFEIANHLAVLANINDLKNISANGVLDADFSIKSDFKKINSSGKLKLDNANVNLKDFNVKIENLIADILLDNNEVLINKLGFSTFSTPFLITGKISKDANCDIDIKTTNLMLKGLLASLGQTALLRENTIYSGTISALIKISNKLLSPKIAGDISLDNLNLHNLASDVKISVNPVKIKLNSTKTGYEGNITASNFNVINPAVTITVPDANALINEKQINLSETLVNIGQNKTYLTASILNYLQDKISIDAQTKNSDINSNLKGTIDNSKQILDLKFSIPQNAVVIIPGFDKSKLIANGYTSITGNMLNPVLTGKFDIQSVEIPEIPVSINDMIVNLNGTVLNGNMELKSFKSAGIEANSIKSNYKMDKNVFYLNDLKGGAFGGEFSGNIAYDMASTKCDVVFYGGNMDALKAIEGAAGIKNALSGTLGFNADVNFRGIEYNEMMKTLSGNADFKVEDGVLANLGGLSSLLNAQNILSIPVLNSALKTATSISVVDSASKFDYITGDLTFKNGFANLASIKMSGPSMAYYVTGKYNLISGYTDVTILGRLAENVVGVLGSLGDLSSNKITSLISNFGNLTASIAKSLNESPKNVDLAQIPSLSSNSASKDFKAVFQGPITGVSSVKSFKWLNEADISSLDSSNNSVNKAVQNALDNVKINTTETKETLKDTANQAKQIFKSLMTK